MRSGPSRSYADAAQPPTRDAGDTDTGRDRVSTGVSTDRVTAHVHHGMPSCGVMTPSLADNQSFVFIMMGYVCHLLDVRTANTIGGKGRERDTIAVKYVDTPSVRQ